MLRFDRQKASMWSAQVKPLYFDTASPVTVVYTAIAQGRVSCTCKKNVLEMGEE